jgi:pimeloyl-ACP methyl ester carboxylesterase
MAIHSRVAAVLPVYVLSVVGVLACAGSPARGADVENGTLDQLESTRSTLFDAPMVQPSVGGNRAFILKPAQPDSADPKVWVWYAPTLLADSEDRWISPGERHAWIFKRLLARGIYVAGVDVGESWGSPAGRAIYDRFYDLLVERYGLTARPGLLAISRGGLMAYNWAADHSDRVGCIGAIYPLCNLRSYPRIQRLTGPYGMSTEELQSQMHRHNPLARIGTLANAGVPILHLHGDRDTVLPLEAHSGKLVERYRDLGGRADLIIIRGKGHEVVPEFWQDVRLVDFFAEHLTTTRRSR